MPSSSPSPGPGAALRSVTPRAAQGNWSPPTNRARPQDLLERSNTDRLPDLIPLRLERMSKSPFAFFRGSAIIMAHDLAQTPSTGLLVQSCGDCHLQNFGWFATPERKLIFDLTDFDETLPAPWEWDLKRLATSCILAAKSESDGRDVAEAACRAYRTGMAEFSTMPALQVWYTQLDLPFLMRRADAARQRRALQDFAANAQSQTIERWLPKLTTGSGLQRRFQKPSKAIVQREEPELQMPAVQKLLEHYQASVQEDRRELLRRFQLVDVGFKIVGVGSVGLRCLVALLLDSRGEPLVLQIKEARPSVLAPFVGGAVARHDGHRVVHGQRLMQSASDPFLGWGDGVDGRSYYVRQLRDMKLSVEVIRMTLKQQCDYAELCGLALARAHAKSGASEEIAGYLGRSAKFDQAIVSFAVKYAPQVMADFAALSESWRR